MERRIKLRRLKLLQCKVEIFNLKICYDVVEGHFSIIQRILLVELSNKVSENRENFVYQRTLLYSVNQ